MKKEIVAWIIVDDEMAFCDIEEKYHILRTRKKAQEYIKKQFFPAKKMGWKVKKAIISLI